MLGGRSHIPCAFQDDPIRRVMYIRRISPRYQQNLAPLKRIHEVDLKARGRALIGTPTPKRDALRL